MEHSPPRLPEERAQPPRREGRPPAVSGGRLALALAGGGLMFACLLFLPAGRLSWGAGWAYLGLVMLNMGTNLVYLKRRNPLLIEQRMRFTGEGTKSWDKVWALIFSPLMFAIYVVAALDAGRHGWSSMSPWLWCLGFAFFVPGTALFSWSMGVNPFFEKTVRIQRERGHYVVDEGPYRFVRHPGYVGFTLGWILSAPFLLQSWWAFVPVALCLVGLVVRTALEDRTLQEELPGYREYAGRVRYRLLPGLW